MKLMTRVEEVESVPRSKGSKRPRLDMARAAAKWVLMRGNEGLSSKICPIFGIVHVKVLLKRGRYGWRDLNSHFGKD